MTIPRDAVRRSGLPDWELVRAEILTPDELEQEWAAAEGGSGAVERTVEGPPHAEMVGNDLLRRALHNPVTGLAGRELFLDEVRRASVTAAVDSAQAVMVVHVDGHGSAERSCDRPASDELLSQIARRLVETLRRDDKLARVAPAEFAVLVGAPSGDDSDCVARRIVDCVGRPLPGEAQPLPVTASVGVAKMEAGRDADQLIGMAEAAMVAARGRAETVTVPSRLVHTRLSPALSVVTDAPRIGRSSSLQVVPAGQVALALTASTAGLHRVEELFGRSEASLSISRSS